MNIYKVLPDLKKKRHLGIWHKALRAQWSATDLNWDRPERITSRRLKDQLARVLTPEAKERLETSIRRGAKMAASEVVAEVAA